MFTYEIKDVNEYTREITGEISHDIVEKQIEKVCRELKKDLVIPGFRKGKIPISMLKKRFAKEIKSQVKEELFNENFPEIIKETKLHPVNAPDIQEMDYEEGKPLTFKFTVESIIMDQPKDYLGVQIEVEKAVVTDEEIDQYLKTMQYRRGEIQVVDNRPVQNEDLLIVDIDVTEGETDIDSLYREKIQIQVGRNNYINDARFDEQLIGMNQGESKTFPLDFDQNEPNEELKGKQVTFLVRVDEIKTIVLPELDDEFAKSFGDYSSLADLKEQVRTSFLEQKESKNHERALGQLFDKIIEQNKIILPPRIVSDYASDMKKQYASRTGLDVDTDEIQKEFEKNATKELKKMVLINKIADLEKIEVEEAEVTKFIDTIGQYYKKQSRQDLVETQDRVRRNMTEGKTVEFLYEKAEKTIVNAPEKNGLTGEKTESDSSESTDDQA
ncbi:trigger factor [bacterium]|nr:trigger factor [bacterium]